MPSSTSRSAIWLTEVARCRPASLRLGLRRLSQPCPSLWPDGPGRLSAIASDAYVYGPICVEETERGQGVAATMFAALRARLPGREGVLFIRRDNEASLRAHTKLGMSEAAEFKHKDRDFAVLSYVG
jgi:GNAT superfamily N-acetyltransferase